MHAYRAATIAALFLLAGCETDVAPLSAQGTAVIPGSETVGQTPRAAMQTVLVEAAHITLNHGYQNFRVVAGYGGAYAVTPGADVAIQVVNGDDARPGVAGVWDAEQIIDNGVPDSALAALSSPTPLTSPPTQRCTAYGCVW
jgi:hypothetical protein